MILRKLLCNAVLANSAFYNDISFTCKCRIINFEKFYEMFQITIESSVSQHFPTVYVLIKQNRFKNLKNLARPLKIK